MPPSDNLTHLSGTTPTYSREDEWWRSNTLQRMASYSAACFWLGHGPRLFSYGVRGLLTQRFDASESKHLQNNSPNTAVDIAIMGTIQWRLMARDIFPERSLRVVPEAMALAFPLRMLDPKRTWFKYQKGI